VARAAGAEIHLRIDWPPAERQRPLLHASNERNGRKEKGAKPKRAPALRHWRARNERRPGPRPMQGAAPVTGLGSRELPVFRACRRPKSRDCRRCHRRARFSNSIGFLRSENLEQRMTSPRAVKPQFITTPAQVQRQDARAGGPGAAVSGPAGVRDGSVAAPDGHPTRERAPV